jgi:hypothetical protein
VPASFAIAPGAVSASSSRKWLHQTRTASARSLSRLATLAMIQASFGDGVKENARCKKNQR